MLIRAIRTRVTRIPAVGRFRGQVRQQGRGRILIAFAVALIATATPSWPTSAQSNEQLNAWEQHVPAIQLRADQLCRLRPSVSTAKHDDVERADSIMRGRISLMGSPEFTLARQPSWKEGLDFAPFQATFQGLTWADVLRRRWLQTRDHRYLARYERLLRSWVAVAGDSKRPLTRWTWYDMAQGQRAAVFACAMSVLGPRPWLVSAVRDAQALLLDAKASHYDGEGNHSLWQDMGLLTLSRLIADQRGVRLAVFRMGVLLRGAVSAAGESTEGASVYQELNWKWWSEAVALARPAQIPGAARVEAMAQVYADLVTPSGMLLAFGDAQAERPAVDTPPPPSPRSLSLMPELGIAQARNVDAGSMVALRYGAAGTRQLHGHRDAGSVQFHSCGRTLLGDGGMYAYSPSTAEGQRARRFVQSAAAHSVVLPVGTSADSKRRTTLVVHDDASAVVFKAAIPLVNGRWWTRRLYFSRTENYMVVEDEVPGGGRQLWQLPQQSMFKLSGGQVVEAGDSGSCRLALTWQSDRELAVVSGAAEFGWMSASFGILTPRPTVVAVVPKSGATAVMIQAETSSQSVSQADVIPLGNHRYRITTAWGTSVVDLDRDPTDAG